ncbi:MAG: sporulation transcription factor Spo0A [Peptococcaceae bacterium]|nr:sporulation transcription factor Spo0A [Peptococcaceae bacterium]
MNKNIKVVIADDNQGLCQMLKEYFDSLDYLQVVGVANNGLEAWELIQSNEPDLVIIDLVMPSLDGLGVLEKINSRTMSQRPKMIMLTAFGQENLTQQAMQLGIDYFVLKPFDLEILGKRICSLTQGTPLSNHVSSASAPPVTSVATGLNLSVEVTNIMHQIGIPAHVKGYQYIRDAILLVVENVSLLGAVTKELYPMIAKKYNTAPSRVERGIRHAIELAWERGHTETLKRIFGYSMNIERQKPTNSEFIALLADKLRVMSKVS